MVRLGGAASPTYISVFRGLQTHFRQHGIDLDWVLYADYDALVEAFVKRGDRSRLECPSGLCQDQTASPGALSGRGYAGCGHELYHAFRHTRCL